MTGTETDSINECINDIAAFVYDGIIEIEYLIKACVEYVAERQCRHKDNDWHNGGKRYVHKLLPMPGAIDLRGFVEVCIDTGNGGQIDDRPVAEFLPYMGGNNCEREPFIVPKEDNGAYTQ